jgi:hypothetical protein
MASNSLCVNTGKLFDLVMGTAEVTTEFAVLAPSSPVPEDELDGSLDIGLDDDPDSEPCSEAD